MTRQARKFLGIYLWDQGEGMSVSVALALVVGLSLEYSSRLLIRDGKKESSDLLALQREFSRVLKSLSPDVVVLRGRDMRRGPWEKLRKAAHAEGAILAALGEQKVDFVLETGASLRATAGGKTSSAISDLVSQLMPALDDWAIEEAAAAALAEYRQRQ
jgi:Holliday junction resolvasome RuvABC endonuclease subunit